MDPFERFASGLESPATRHFEIVPDDAADLPVIPRSIYVNAAGTAVIVDSRGAAVSYDLTAGQILPLRAARVMATGTTAALVGWL